MATARSINRTNNLPAVQTTYKGFIINELLFSGHYKTDANNRFDLRLAGAVLEPNADNGAPIPKEIFGVAQGRARQALQHWGSRVLDRMRLDFGTTPKSKRPKSVVVVFGEIVMQYQGKTLTPNFSVPKEAGSAKTYKGNVFAAVVGNVNATKVYQVVTVMVFPRSTQNGDMTEDPIGAGDHKQAIALTTEEKLPLASTQRPKLTIDLDVSNAAFDLMFPPVTTHGVNNSHLHTPEQQSAFERELADEARAASSEEQVKRVTALDELGKQEKADSKEMGLRIGDKFMYAKWDMEAGAAVARKYEVVNFFRKAGPSFQTITLKPKDRVPVSETFYVSAKPVYPTAMERDRPPALLSFQPHGPQYLFVQDDGSTYINTLALVYRSHHDKPGGKARMIFLGEEPLRAKLDRQPAIAEGQVVANIRVRKPAGA